MLNSKYRSKTFSLLTALLGFVVSKSSFGAPLDLANSPLFLGTAVDPNVFYVLDDSGSMDWEILTAEHYPSYCYDRAHPASNSDSDCTTGNINDDGLWNEYGGGGFQVFEYMFTITDHAYSGSCTSNRERVESCNDDIDKNDWAYRYDWRIFSSDVNVIYYDPSLVFSRIIHILWP